MTKLLWDACYNVRDVGGMSTAFGRSIRSGVLVRSDLLSRLTPEGKQALLGYGISTVIDLRWPDEVAKDPSAFIPGTPKPGEPVYHILPVENRNSPVIGQIDNAASQAEGYCLTMDYCRPELVEIVRTVADAPAGGVLVHCHAGKDRTGMVVALLLGLVGVPDEEIVADYAASEEQLWPLYRQWEAQFAGDPVKLAWLYSKTPVSPPEVMGAVLEHLRNRYGGVRAYLLGAGLSETELARIEDRLLEV
ncbi:MAG: tyrosine-protein phosphatase [Chloroflexi bacterium]|nr:MAG: tyrosine-protein phosphatase [Chloroflexota bacterium]